MGLLGTMAKTAVVSGTATATRSAINRRQADKNVAAYSHAQQQVQGQQVQYTQPAAAAPPGPQVDTVSQLERLGALRDQGVLTDEEFQAQKAKILGS
jgi:hypothetical protein